MSEGPAFGVTPDGFVIKGIDEILAGAQSRARTMFGDDVDLSSGSALRKVLDANVWDVHDLWRALESQHYACFVTTAQGASLNLLGTNLGLERRQLFARGTVTVTLGGTIAAGRRYVLPEGTPIDMDATVVALRTVRHAVLDAGSVTAEVDVEAVVRGPEGEVPVGSNLRVVPAWLAANLRLDGATLTVTNPAAVRGGDLVEADDVYRSRLLGIPRTLWTRDAVLSAVLDVDGVRDADVFDPLGGVDVSQSYFGVFAFGQRAFSRQRQSGSPYYFDVVVATRAGYDWVAAPGSGLRGVREAVLEVVRDQRPVSVFPNLVHANSVDVGVRARLVAEAGHDRDAVRGAFLDLLAAQVENLRLGRGVLFSDVLVLAREVPGVVDVQRLHLRRGPAALGGINFDGGRFGEAAELAGGENIELAPDEIALFGYDSPLNDIEVVGR
ncbi:hypothetical protein ASF98_21435 [Arthrobacter sp. Leaf337]|uniref:baseplate J/gp47 family protein n=1 Tax=Arthrobacter sp. Leaf337 TaxID=1736342 RepID=UPI0006F4BD4A|nr:baseplate J/gp47 family protein [Arthrobacter sp. Leaf337]KQR77313.1 hypothetical protein ASF98_21435 [Arthrobacter sp. Leaf337]